MKNLVLGLLLLVSAFPCMAQPIDEINEFLSKQDYAAARRIADKYVNDPKNQNKPEAWYFKGFTYKFSLKDATLSETDKFDFAVQSLDAFRKYLSMDPKQTWLKLEANASIRDLYFDFYEFGIRQFNNKAYESAYRSFQKALEVKDLALQQKYEYTEVKFYLLDTALVVNAGMAAAQSNHETEGVAYFMQISDADVSGPDFAAVYEFLADYYSKSKDNEKLQAILAKARRFYPDNEFWDSVEIRTAEGSGDEKQLMAKYEERIAATPGNFALLYDYSLFLYKSLYEGDEKNITDPEVARVSDKLTETLTEAIKTDPGIDASVLMTSHLFNEVSSYTAAISMARGTKPEEVKKRNDLKQKVDPIIKQFLSYGDATLAYFESQTSLKPIQKATYRNVASYMSEVYNYLGDTKKEALYTNKRKDPKMQ